MPLLPIVKYDQGWTVECGTDSLAEVLDALGMRTTSDLSAWLEFVHECVHNDHFRYPGDYTSIAQIASGIVNFCQKTGNHLQYEKLYSADAVQQQVVASHDVLIEVQEADLQPGQRYYHFLRIIGQENDRYAVVDSYGREDHSDQQASNGVVWYPIDEVNRADNDGPSGEPWGIAIWKEDGGMAGVPHGWNDDGTTLTSPAMSTLGVSSPVPISLGFRDYILNHDWDPTNIAMKPAYGLDQLEYSNPSLGTGTQQPFLTKVLEWTPNTGVLEMWVGREFVALRNVIDQQSATIKSLQDQLRTAQQNLQDIQNLPQQEQQVISAVKTLADYIRGV